MKTEDKAEFTVMFFFFFSLYRRPPNPLNYIKKAQQCGMWCRGGQSSSVSVCSGTPTVVLSLAGATQRERERRAQVNVPLMWPL